MSKNPKGDLIERCQREGLGKPVFKTQLRGPEHQPHFECQVYLGERLIGTGEGGTKKRAERLAAEASLQFLEQSQNLEPVDVPGTSEVKRAEPFEGPWPLFPEVLAASLQVANSRVDPKLLGVKGLEQVRDLSLKLYKEVLESLGEVIEIEEGTA